MANWVKRTITMGADEWRKMAAEARERAVGWATSEASAISTRSAALTNAAELLRAATTFDGHANGLEMFGGADIATEEVWDEEAEDDAEAAAWPRVSAELKEALAGNKKALRLVDQIDRLTEAALDQGLPVVTNGQVAEMRGIAQPSSE